MGLFLFIYLFKLSKVLREPMMEPIVSFVLLLEIITMRYLLYHLPYMITITLPSLLFIAKQVLMTKVAMLSCISLSN